VAILNAEQKDKFTALKGKTFVQPRSKADESAGGVACPHSVLAPLWQLGGALSCAEKKPGQSAAR